MPWTSSCPSSSVTAAVKSSAPADEPAFTTTMSAASSAVSTAARIPASESAWMAYGVASAPHSVAVAASMVELKSMMAPGAGVVPTGTSSLPVGMIATRGRRRTSTSWWPAAAIAPRSIGRRRCPAGATSSVATMSSPIGRTCCHGATAARISIVPSRWSWMSSIITTASISGGIGSPVSTHVASGPIRSGLGEVSDAPTVAAARTAAPSIAAAW